MTLLFLAIAFTNVNCKQIFTSNQPSFDQLDRIDQNFFSSRHESLQQAKELLKFTSTPNEDLPKFIPSPYRDAFHDIYHLLRDSNRISEHMDSFEKEVYVMARFLEKWGKLDFEKALERATLVRMEDMEQSFGFRLADIIFPFRNIKDFHSFLKEGKIFNDTILNGDGHGVMTHRIQWQVILREAAANPDFLRGHSPLEVYKALGSENLNQLTIWPRFSIGMETKSLWAHLLDQSVAENFSSPDFILKNSNLWPFLRIY